MRNIALDSPQETGALLEETWSRSEVMRHRLARRLHDDVCGQLIGSLMDLSLIRNQLPPALSELSAKLQRSCDVLSSAVRANRELVEELRPSLLDNVGLFAALKWHVVEACRTAGIPCSARLPIDEPSLQTEVAVDLFRLVEEGMQVIMSQSSQIERIEVYAVQADDRITITLAAVGAVVPPASHELPTSLRLKLMSIRAQLADAVCALAYPDAGGSSITIAAGHVPKAD